MESPEQQKKASLVGAFFIFLFSTFQAQAFCPVAQHLQFVRVSKVIDGDTLRLDDGRSVRLIGMNAPETGHNGIQPEPFAEAARKRLQALVTASNERIGLRIGQQGHDRYGRLLAHAYDARGRNLEALLLAEGLGYFVALAPNTDLVDCHSKAEHQARLTHSRLWRQSPVGSVEMLNRPGFSLLEVQIERVRRNRGGIWLETTASLVVNIPLRVLDVFDEALLSALPGKRVEVRGWVIEHGTGRSSGQRRWLLPVTHPAMLRELN
ncbi:thermonuclease family protein [Azomonas macrocytogenes]|uniref:Endonuclease YncB(Thermonuclease family) n=1 Tax=Azomonas macrocytogenes TaxID=69962 RepID=A0A839T1Q5_AZOMA|nr:thermonuclease family protein [Azomonas macrocytogenes]MBB3102899.1 endonuclease YncB(thermonuclease family) [Azomonas macrocytogenes]